MVETRCSRRIPAFRESDLGLVCSNPVRGVVSDDVAKKSTSFNANEESPAIKKKLKDLLFMKCFVGKRVRVVGVSLL